MLNRYRWYRIQVPNHTASLASIFTSHPLGTQTNFGFALIEGSLGGAMYRFLWRTKVVVTLIDDSGITSYQEVGSVDFTDFAIIVIEGETFFRIENPGRNIRDLLNALETLLGLGFTCKVLTFDKVMPTTIFEYIENVKLIGFKVVDAVITNDLLARMEFTSKQGMIKENLKQLEGVQYKFESATYELAYEGVRGQMTISSSGSVKIWGGLAPKLVHLIEQDLAKLI